MTKTSRAADATLARRMACLKERAEYLLQKQIDGNFIGPVSIEFDRYGAAMQVHIYHVVIPIQNGRSTDEVVEIARALGTFCNNEDVESEFEYEGRTYMLGDGDDMGAVWFENGAFRMWLRTWE